MSLFASTQLDAVKTDRYSGVPVVFQVVPFDIDPPQCRVTYACTSVTDINDQVTPITCSDFTFDGDFNGQSTDGKLTITITADKYTDSVYPAQDYFITITGTAVNSNTQVTTVLQLTLLDPCDPPNSLVAPALMNQVYTLTDPNAPSYTVGAFTIEPAYCEFTLTYSITTLTSVVANAPDSAITQTGNVFDFFYNNELPDMSQKQTVTVTATSTSSNSELTAQASFDLTFLDACSDSTLVTLTPVAQSAQFVNNYDGQTITFTYTPYTVSPAWCDVTVTCVSVSSNLLACQDLDSNGQATWSFDGDDYTNGITPGTYTTTYNVQVGGQSSQFTVEIELEDPCKNPVITVPDATTLTYVITDDEVKYTLTPMFSVTPDFCPYELTVNVDGIDVVFDEENQEITIPSIPDDLSPSDPNNDGSTE